MREQLLGYVLGALDASEQAELETRLAADPQLRRDLEEVRASLAPLDEDDTDPAPPVGLAERTCRFVCSYAGWRPWTQERAGEASSSNGAWRVQDVLVAAGIFVSASMLIFPAVSNSVSGARRLQCQNNLRLLGIGLHHYDEKFGQLPAVPLKGNMAVAGIIRPMLSWGGFVPGDTSLLCPEAATDEQRNQPVPSRQDFERASLARLSILQANAGGNFAYYVGYLDSRGFFHPAQIRRRVWFAIVGDAPGFQPGGCSPNHGGKGQNVLMECGRVVFLVECRNPETGDDFYSNALGLRGAGIGADDACLSPSDTPPIVFPAINAGQILTRP